MAQFKAIIAEKHILFVFIACCLSSGNGESTVILKNTETSIGAIATLYCKSPISSIEWHHLPVGRSVHEIVYQDGYLFNGYRERFSVNRKDNGEYNLEIRNVKSTDAGNYTCLEKSEVARQKSAELVVFEQYPSNKSCAAKYTCTPACEALELSCSMKSHGKIIPSMEWRESTKGILTSNSITANNITISYIHVVLLRGNSRNLTYTCSVKYPLDSSLTSQFSWSYLVSAPASLAQSSSDEEHQVQSDATGFIVGIAVLVAFVVGMAVFIALLWYKNRRITAGLAGSRQAKGANSMVVDIGSVLENTCLLKPEENTECTCTRCKDVRKDLESEIEQIRAQDDQDESARRLVPRTTPNKNKSIQGIAVLDDEIFIVTRDGCIVEVFHLYTAKFRRAWMVEGLVNPNDLAICSVKGFIFICDWKKAGKRSEIFLSDKNGKNCSSWPCEIERGRISITKETNVIVAENYLNTINEYTHFGRSIKKYDTGKQKLHLEHAVKLENGNFIACFGDVQDSIREICIIDSQGITVSSFNQDSFQQVGVQLSVPRSLAVDKEGTIYMCDVYSCRIILLTLELQNDKIQLKYKEKIEEGENEERFRGPLRMCIHESEEKRQLIVADSVKKAGDWTDGKILVANLTLPNQA